VLAVAGAALGLLLAWLATRSLIAAQPADIPRLEHISMSSTVVSFTAIIALLTGILFGTLPALQVTGAGMTQSLKESGRGAQSGVRGARVRGALVVSELALAIVLLFGAGLLIRSFLQMTRVDTGFRTENALTFRVSLQGTTYNEPARREQFFARLEERLLALPGVTAVGAATGLPMTGQGSILGPFSVEGQEVPANVLPEIRLQTVTPGYFETLGAPLLMGRALDVRDRSDAPLVALFNRAAIARWFPDGNPVGQRVLLGGTPFQVVGIVADVMQRAPGRPIEPEMYIPHAQDQTRTLRYVVRGTGDMAAVAARIPREVHALDGDIPVETVNALSSLFTDAVARPRLYTTLLTLFAAIALALAVIGIFGVVSYLVAQRSREISIRMALGANARNVVGMIVGGAMKIAGAGLLVGLGAALVGARVLQSQLFGVRVVDPTTLVAAVALLGAAAAVASLIPALRAARSDPGAVLRDGA
jgi:predicted permease